jgi:anti-anti-sigma factor
MGTGQALTTRIDTRNGVANITLSGELDMGTVPILHAQLTAVEQDGAGAIMLDLRDLNFIDSTGLQAFVQAYSRSKVNGHRFLLVGASPITRRLFEITRTEFLLDAEGSVELLGRFMGDGSRDGDRDGESVERHA